MFKFGNESIFYKKKFYSGIRYVNDLFKPENGDFCHTQNYKIYSRSKLIS